MPDARNRVELCSGLSRVEEFPRGPGTPGTGPGTTLLLHFAVLDVFTSVIVNHTSPGSSRTAMVAANGDPRRIRSDELQR